METLEIGRYPDRTPALRLFVKDEKTGHEVVLFFDRDVPPAVAQQNLARCGVWIGKRKLKALMEQAMTVADGSVH